MITENFKLSIQVIGIKKRCRKSDRHFFHFGYLPYNNGEFDKSAINDKIRDFLITNMKTVESLTRVSLDYVTSSSDDESAIIQWKPFSDKNVSFDLNIVL